MHRLEGGRRDDDALSFSVVICTDGRAESLRETLRSLEYLEYSNFEVCVVYGPTEDDTLQVLAAYDGRIKTAHNPTRNLSISRNIGIALASGQIVAFLDDDAIPEPEWMRDLAAAYADPHVGGVGGFVYDHTGVSFQFRYSTVDRLGRQTDRDAFNPDICFPLTANFPHMLGANSSFRRDALLAVGGFDEEFDYYLDETDVTARIVDADWAVSLIEGAYVHHKFLPSSMRNVEDSYRILRHWYPIIKNKIYFALRHGRRHFSFNAIIDEASRFIEKMRTDIAWAKAEGYLTDVDERQFWQEVDQAWVDGLARGFANTPRLLSDDTLRQWASPFLPFGAVAPEGGRRTYCFVSQEYTVGKMGGIGRYTHELAAAAAAMGHHVHVITLAQGSDRLDYEGGVWVHRVVDRPATAPQPGGLKMPWYRWSRASTVLKTIDAINARRPVDAVSAPIWDCEGIALLGRYPLVTVLLTSMVPWLQSNPLRASDRKFMREHARPMIEAETYLMRHSDRIVHSTHAILDEMKQLYGMRFAPARLSLIAYGLSDWTTLPREAPAPLAPGSLRVVFVGRLEERKGIDVLLSAATRLLARHPNVSFDLVGDDTIPGPPGRTWRQAFEADPQTAPIRSRVRFHGAVDDERLRGFYAAADIFVAPSRFESFGLILVEGMMFGKPIVGCRAGGMVEVVEDGVSGLLAEPGDADSLEARIERLIDDAQLRARMGAAARARYEQRFTAERMATSIVETMRSAAAHEAQADELPVTNVGAAL